MKMTIERGVPKMFTPKQVAVILGISRSQVYVLIKSRELESVTIRGSRRVSESQLIKYIKKLEE
jgi:excisionase family DNA binding protein